MRVFAALLLARVAYAGNDTEMTTATANDVPTTVANNTDGGGGGGGGTSATSVVPTQTSANNGGTSATSVVPTQTSANNGGSQAESTEASNSTSSSSTAAETKEYVSQMDMSFAGVGTAVTGTCAASTGFLNVVLLATMCTTKHGLEGTGTTGTLSGCTFADFVCAASGSGVTSGSYCLKRAAAPENTGLFGTLGAWVAADNMYGVCGRRQLSETRRLSTVDVTVKDKVTIKVLTAQSNAFAAKKTALDGVDSAAITTRVNAIQSEVVTKAANSESVGGLALTKITGGNTVTFTGMNITAAVTKVAVAESSSGGSTSSAATAILSGAALVGAALMF